MAIEIFGKVADMLRVQEDFVRIAFMFILNIVLSGFFRRLTTPIHRQLYSFVPGVLFLVLMLEEWSLYVILTGVGCYFLLNQIPRRPLLIASLLSFTLLMFIHIYRSIFDYDSWKLDCSVMQMFMTTKVVYYGLYLEKNRPLGLLEYLGYAFFFPGVLIGPTFSIETYQKFIGLKEQYSNIRYSTDSVINNILKGLGYSVLTVLIAPRFPPSWSVTSDFAQESGFFMRVVTMFFIGILYRIKFYTGWSFTQAAVNNSGISYDTKGGFTEVDCGSAMYEIEYNPRLKTEHWNASVQKWLKTCFYEPVSALYPKNQTIPLMVVFLFSAIWHGIYLTYYIGFMQWAVVSNVSKFIYKASWKFGKWEGTPQLKVLAWIVSNLFMNYIGMHILMLNFRLGIAYYNNLYWSGTIIMIAAHLFFSLTGWGQRPSKPKNLQQDNEEKIK